MSLDSIEIAVADVDEFWYELEEILTLPGAISLDVLDNTLRMVISLFSSSHDKYMQSPGESSHAYYLLLKSDLFRYHSERMINLILAEAEENTNPHTLFILYNILLLWGSKHHSLFRSHRRWKRLSRGLGDVFDAEIDERSVDSDGNPPIEARLRLPATQLMYEVLRVQKLSAEELEGFTDDFIDRLFELVETSRNFDEELNYAVIRLIIALNEQFMVASAQSVVPKQGGLKPPEDPSHGLLSPTPAAPDARTLLSPPPEHLPPSMAPTTRNHHRAHSNSHPPLHVIGEHGPAFTGEYHAGQEVWEQQTEKEKERQREKEVEETKGKNRVLGVLMSRLGNSKTFGENVIFMLNRCQNTPDDLCVQLLLLKILYLLFTTAGTQEYFYTNDLRVLVDVFLRELVDLPEESEACRHTYLRVLHPLLTNTQLKSEPYKHPQIRLVLLSLTSHSHIREVDPTTKRLVERCLNADWGDGGGRGAVVAGLRHIPLTGENEPLSLEANHGHMIVPENVKGMSIDAPAPVEEKAPKMKRGQSLLRKLGRSQSAEDMPKLHKSHLNVLKVDTNPSTLSLHVVAAAAPPVPNRAKKKSKGLSIASTELSPHQSESGWSDADAVSMRSTPTLNGAGQGQGQGESMVMSPASYEAPNSACATGGRSWLSGKRRKPPAVPDRKAKPGAQTQPGSQSQSQVESEEGTLGRSKTHPAWSPEFEADDPMQRAGEGKEEEKKEKHGLGFAALAQALQEAGGRRRSTKGKQAEDDNMRTGENGENGNQNRLPAIVVESEGNDGTASPGKREGRWYQATGWTTFA